MIYTELVNKALNIAYEAHKNQKDKAGVLYIYHPYHLAEQMEDETQICVALLHNVVEDSSLSEKIQQTKKLNQECKAPPMVARALDKAFSFRCGIIKRKKERK